MMRFSAVLFVSIALTSAAIVTGCGADAGVRAHASSLPTAPFAQYHTFSFAPGEGAPGGYKTSASSAEIQERMKPLITAALQNKGYSLAPAKGDFVIRFGSGRREVVVVHAKSTQLDSFMEEDENDDFVEGALVIDAFDGSNDGQIWHGGARTQINPSHVDDALLKQAIDAVLVKFPAATPSTPSPNASSGRAATPPTRRRSYR